MKGRTAIWTLALSGCVSLLALVISSGIWSEYGGHNLRIALAGYVEANDGEWLESWRDIEPYHSDVLLGVQSTFFVRKFWGVAWKIDPEEVLAKEAPPNATRTPVIYRLSRVADPDAVDYWDLGEKITEFYGNRQR